MTWPSLRDFLRVPGHLTGRGVGIALVDGSFASHPDVTADGRRRTYLVETSYENPRPVPLEPTPAPWFRGGAHGVWGAAAAAGAGALSGGRHAGVAPEADLFLVAGWAPGRPPREDQSALDREASLRWVLDHHREWGIRAVLTSHMGKESPLLPWQTDPQRRVAEALSAAGVLVVAGTGNMTGATATVSLAAAPSALSVGGVILTEDGDATGPTDPMDAPPYHGCRGVTFEGKWVPQVLAPSENLVLPCVDEKDLRDHFWAEADRDTVPPGYARMEGASFGGPVALGAAACVWQAHPAWSARQVAAALVSTAVQRPQWAPLRAGLISVSAAVAATPDPDSERPIQSPYERWRHWRSQSPVARLRAAQGSDEQLGLDALLSFLPDEVPPDVGGAVLALADYASPAIRTAALCLLATRPSSVPIGGVERALRDDDARVRVAGVLCLARCPHHWEELAPALAALLVDADPDVRIEAIGLAGRLRDPRLVPALVDSVEDSAARWWVYTWGRACRALAAITGVDFPQAPAWQRGECHYTPRRQAARLDVAERWRSWLHERRR